MKWWLVLVAFVLGVLVTWLLSRRGGGSVPTTGPAVSHSEPLDGAAPSDAASDSDDDPDVSDPSAFAGAPSEFTSDVGAAESWDRDAQDEDALLPHEPVSAAGIAEAEVPPVAEATPNGDLAGVGEPEAVQAVDAVEVQAEVVTQDEALNRGPSKAEQGAFTFDEVDAENEDTSADNDDKPGDSQSRN
ncbi:hypothetical protein [Terrabacter sp. 2RAF25]|uniref:hypothetical protein n=1 Tax=Terrabacter sp. 2RAF25 TaxID=3232998 RepID=UPI003F99763C